MDNLKKIKVILVGESGVGRRSITCGQEKYRHLSKSFLKGTKAAILVYDTTSKSSFNEIQKFWYNLVKENSSEDLNKYFAYCHI